jgi:hypothetical protein
MLFRICGTGRQREMESGAATNLRFDPNSSPMVFDDFLADSQPHSVPGVFFPGMQALKDDEDLVLVLGRDTDAIVGYGK